MPGATRMEEVQAASPVAAILISSPAISRMRFFASWTIARKPSLWCFTVCSHSLYTLDLGTHCRKLLFYSLVAAIHVVHAIDRCLAVCDQCRQYE